uniref:Putative ovule protein n=1 Tax=Solanum chacoense TaxID=4108 RepID=A0A0V0HJ76_SOLCH
MNSPLTSATFMHLQYQKSLRLPECSGSPNTIPLSPSSFKSLGKYVCHLRLMCASSTNTLPFSSRYTSLGPSHGPSSLALVSLYNFLSTPLPSTLYTSAQKLSS